MYSVRTIAPNGNHAQWGNPVATREQAERIAQTVRRVTTLPTEVYELPAAPGVERAPRPAATGINLKRQHSARIADAIEASRRGGDDPGAIDRALTGAYAALTAKAFGEACAMAMQILADRQRAASRATAPRPKEDNEDRSATTRLVPSED